MAIEPMRKGLRSALVWLWLAGLLWASGFVFSTHAAAQAEDVSVGETQIKAAFLYKFTGYVEWPKSSFKDPDSPITIGILGADEIADELRRIVSGRSVQNRGLTVAAINKENDLTGVHVLFIGREATARLPRLIEAARQRPILIVTDAADGLERGSIINFVMVKRRVQFEIAVDAAEKAGLTLSSRLLSVALRVKKGDIEPALYLAHLSDPGLPASTCVGVASKRNSICKLRVS
ncbi:MAG: YfiR family protein [Betaproteobacteria bacterium]|nr:YfiR family protein [Betaproteobacteria bacterium]